MITLENHALRSYMAWLPVTLTWIPRFAPTKGLTLETSAFESLCRGQFTSKIHSKLLADNPDWTLICNFSESCTDPGNPQNGRRIGFDFRHGKKVSFTCQANFKLTGTVRITEHGVTRFPHAKVTSRCTTNDKLSGANNYNTVILISIVSLIK